MTALRVLWARSRLSLCQAKRRSASPSVDSYNDIPSITQDMILFLGSWISQGRQDRAHRTAFWKGGKASRDFDKYLRMTHGRSESQQAEANKIRIDDPEKAEKNKAAIAQRQLPRGQQKSEEESGDSDSSELDSSSADKASGSEETPPARASKKTKKKQKARSEDEAPRTKRSKKGKAKQGSISEEETPPTKKSRKEKAKLRGRGSAVQEEQKGENEARVYVRRGYSTYEEEQGGQREWEEEERTI